MKKKWDFDDIDLGIVCLTFLALVAVVAVCSVATGSVGEIVAGIAGSAFTGIGALAKGRKVQNETIKALRPHGEPTEPTDTGDGANP